MSALLSGTISGGGAHGGVPTGPGNTSDVIFLKMPDGADRQQGLIVSGEKLETDLTTQVLDKDGSLPAARHTFTFTCPNRAELKALRNFWRGRTARGLTFWFPTWDFDFKLPDVPTGNPFDFWLPHGSQLPEYWALGSYGYRNVLAIYYDRSWTASNIATVTLNDIAHPGFDKFHLDGIGAGGPDFSPNWTEPMIRFLWLRYGRFDSDEFEVKYIRDGGGIVTLSFMELPDEVMVP